MTHTRTSHITLSYKRGRSGSAITCTYKVTKDVLRDMGLWAAGRITAPPGRELQAWLEKRGCKLDSCDGPAIVSQHADGTTYEQYYRDGKLHRDGGPALICRTADGMTYEKYYREDKLHRDGGPAIIRRYADGISHEKYYRDDKLHREDGPAIVVRFEDGSTVEKYYRDEVLVREKRRPPPRAPKNPKTPGPA